MADEGESDVEDNIFTGLLFGNIGEGGRSETDYLDEASGGVARGQQ